MHDRAQMNDVADQEPEHLAALKDLWFYYAGRYGGLPLDDRTAFEATLAERPRPGPPRDRYVLYPGLASTLPSRITAFREGLQAVGYREPDNVELISRSADGDPTRMTLLAMELVERKVNVLVPVSSPAVKAARSVTTTIPIVAFDLESDPIGSGLINSFSRAGGQVTGVFFDFPEFGKKWLELLKEAMPQLSSVKTRCNPWLNGRRSSTMTS